ncbi:MAG: type IX secretion system membrane protein PorP/SprF [Flavobacteriales bacterium]|nr:type IX secretion system membrane protein PorP/SprF [Flavobacteriales bacterium]
MNKWRKGILAFAFVILNNLSIAQDMHFSQFYASNVYLNPAFAGANVCSRLTAIYRNQWSGIDKAYTSSLVSWDHYIKRHNIGMGLMFSRDVAGSGNLATTLIYPTIAYETRVNRKLGIRFGIQPGLGISNVNFNKLTFGDQIARGGNVSTVETAPSSVSYVDIGAGVLAYSIKYWYGISFNHLNQPLESFYSAEETKLPIKYSAHGGYKFDLNDDEETSITTAFNYRGQKKFDQLDLGFYYTRQVFNIGLWYRGIPGLKRYAPGYSNNDAIAFILGFKTNIMSFGYSYDITISRLTNGNSNGAHELSVSYQFCNLKNQKGKRILIECPSF